MADACRHDSTPDSDTSARAPDHIMIAISAASWRQAKHKKRNNASALSRRNGSRSSWFHRPVDAILHALAFARSGRLHRLTETRARVRVFSLRRRPHGHRSPGADPNQGANDNVSDVSGTTEAVQKRERRRSALASRLDRL